MIPTQLTYRERLQPWCVVRHLPNLQRLTVARFSRRSDAEGYLRALRRLMPTANHVVVFAIAPRASGR
ncbi:MAG: hypothetical protein SW833_16170 [Cyanobacteriota bacterium]|nr:hypothetical protein [Cyanobacteriota bacterium]